MNYADRALIVGELYRFTTPIDRAAETVDGVKNFLFFTHHPGQPAGHPYIARGINPLSEIAGGLRPAICLATKTSRAGSRATPWHDRFDLARGSGRYFGDAKLDHRRMGKAATGTPGNRALLRELEKSQSTDPSVRAMAGPLVCLEQVERSLYRFLGLGVLQSASHVTQLDPATGEPFPNILFEVALLDLSPEGNRLPWTWVNARRDGTTGEDLAPLAWRSWVELGNDEIERVRAVAASPPVRSREAQSPPKGSDLERLLKEIYYHFTDSGLATKHEFEFLAAAVVADVLAESGTYRHAWVTREGGDFGIDFVGSLTVGVPPASTNLVLLGQAKCESPGRSTNAVHVARTVARLRRGWIGAYVTTAWFTEATQRELASDDYPIIMLSGAEVAAAVKRIMVAKHCGTVAELMEAVDRRVSNDPPESALVRPANFGV